MRFDAPSSVACALGLLLVGCAMGGGPSQRGAEGGRVDGGPRFFDAGRDEGPVVCGGAVCDANALCVDPAASRCECNEGWMGDGLTCSDIDECLQGVNPCEGGACFNEPGGYRCGCAAGWTLADDGVTCLDVDECVETPTICGGGACLNAEGGYTCECSPGQGFDGTTCVQRTVLVFRGSNRAEDTAAADAVRARGLTLVETTETSEFISAFDAGGFDLVIWEAPRGSLEDEVESRLVDWIERDGKLIFSFWNLDEEPDMRAALGVTTSSITAWINVSPNPASLVNFFDGIVAPLTTEIADSWADNGDRLGVVTDGFVAAEFAAATPNGAIVVTHEARVVINGFILSDCQRTDNDGDGMSDCAELIANQIDFLVL